jgi:hypothetical protein
MRAPDARLHWEMVEDAVAMVVEINRKDGRPHCLAYATRLEASMVACRDYVRDRGTPED